MAYASASPLQPHMPVNYPQQNLVERSLEPVSRGMVTKEQWEDLKPVILRMYIHEHKSFKQVVKILRDEYTFFPTENQFKKKINQWGFRKNFKGRELLAAIEGINGRENGQLEVKVGGFQVPDRRIKRVQQKQAKLRAPSQHLVSQDYEELDMDQAGDNIPNLSIPSVPVQDVQDVAASFLDQDAEMEMDDTTKLSSSPVDETDEINELLAFEPLDMATLCDRLSSFGFNADPEILQNPTYVNVRIPKREYLTRDDLENITASISTLSDSPQATDSSESTKMALQSGSRKSPLIEPLDWSFIKIALGMGTINTLSPFPNPTPTRINRSSSSGGRTTKWEQIGYNVAKHKVKLCKLVDFFGAENPGALEAMTELAYWYYERYDYKSAEYLYAKAAHAYEKVFGLTDAKTLRYYIRVAKSLYHRGKYLNAENIHNVTNSTILSLFGRTSELGILSTNLLANILKRRKRKSEAEELLRQNVQILLNTYGPWHTQTRNAMGYLNTYYQKFSLGLECERLSCTILQIQNAVLNVGEEERCRVLRILAQSQYSQGNYKKSISTFKNVAAQVEILLGVEHPHTLSTQRWIGNCLWKLGRFAEGEELLQDVLKKELRVLGRECQNLYSTNLALGKALMDMCCHEKAIPYLDASLHIGLGFYPPDTNTILWRVEGLGFCYNEEGRHEEAMELYYQHIQRLRTVGDSQRHISKLHASILECIDKLGWRYEKSEKYKESLTLYHEHLERLLPDVGKDHEVIAELSKWISWDIRQLGKRYEDDSHYELALELYDEHLEKLLPKLGEEHDLILDLCRWIQNLETECQEVGAMDTVMEDGS